MNRPISRFNPQRMTEEEVLSLSTGRDNLLKQMMDDMQVCMHPNSNQHFIFYGPRGIGKSFFTRLLKINHDRSSDFKKSIFIQLPEEQSNLSFVADLIDMVSTKLEGKLFDSMTNRWDMSDTEWQNSKKRLIKALDQVKKTDKIEHVFFTMENLQDFIPKLSGQENGRMRELLSDFSNLTLIGSSLHPDLDNDYSKKLFQVFKKIDLKPWSERDYITYYRKKAIFKGLKPLDEAKTKLSEHRIKAIANFTGGSPRLAVILNSLILNDDILSTLEIMNGIIDELTPYYQDLTKDIPNRSKILFDSLIRMGENITQSQLAAGLQPPQEQKTIAKSFSWLTDNYYVNSIKQKTANVKHYYVRDRLYVLYYQNREIMADQKYSFVETFVEFLTEFYNQEELKTHLEKIDNNHLLSKELLLAYIKKMGIKLEEDCSILQLKDSIVNFNKFDLYLKTIISLINDKKYEEALYKLENSISIHERDSKDLDYYYLMIGHLKLKLQKLEEAFINFKKSIKINPKNADSYFGIGNVYYEIKNYELAIKNYKKSIKLGNQSSNLYSNLGDIYSDIKNYNLAIENYIQSLKINSNNLNSATGLGIAYSQIKEFKKSIEFTLKAIQLGPTNHELYLLLGVNYIECNDFQKAEESWSKSLVINPNQIITYRALVSLAFAKLKNKDKAEQYIQEGLKIEPHDEDFLATVLLFYINFDDFKKINSLFSTKNQEFGFIVANALFNLLNKSLAQNFNKIMKVLTWLENDQKDWVLPFASSLTSALYAKKEYELLNDFIDELELKSKSNSSIKILIQAWKYILHPDEIDFAALHPDARIAVQAVLETR